MTQHLVMIIVAVAVAGCACEEPLIASLGSVSQATALEAAKEKAVEIGLDLSQTEISLLDRGATYRVLFQRVVPGYAVAGGLVEIVVDKETGVVIEVIWHQ